MSVGHAIKAINPTRLIVVFDGKDGSARRRTLYPEYKANRKVTIRLNRSEIVDKEDNQLQQLIRLTEYLQVMPVSVVVVDRAEADDVIAYLTNDLFNDEDSQIFIMSSDKDFMQLVNKRVHIWSPTKKRMFYEEDVVEEYGIIPQNFALYRAMIGDDSDNIPGIEGVGAKTLIKYFPKISTDPMTVEEFMQYAKDLQTNNKGKIYEKVVQSESELKLYYEIMQLEVSNINISSKMNIMDMINQPTQKLAKIKFHQMLILDQMTNTIRNVEMWLRETTSKLDQFCLQN